jgi:hypothetical protein
MKRIATLAGALAACLALAHAGRIADQKIYVLKDGTECGPDGTATSDAGKDLNDHKNRFAAPQDEELDPEVSLPAMLAPGFDRQRFDQDKGARISGFVIRVSPGGKGETCNCGATTPVDMDTHIQLGLSANAEETDQVIVEVTPRLRKQMKDRGEDWSSAALKAKLEGKWVEFTGWLLFDIAHIKEAENTHPNGPRNWRATCWEVHPVTSFRVLIGPPAALTGVQPAAVHALRKAHADHVKGFAGGMDVVSRRNERLLSKFDTQERKQFEEESLERTKKDR